MKSLFGRRSAIVTAAIATALVISGCSSVNDSASEGSGDCGSYAIAMHAWGGYTASAQVLAEVAKQGCGMVKYDF